MLLLIDSRGASRTQIIQATLDYVSLYLIRLVFLLDSGETKQHISNTSGQRVKKSIEMVLLCETREKFAAVVFVRDAVH